MHKASRDSDGNRGHIQVKDSLIHQQEPIMNVYVPNNTAVKYVKPEGKTGLERSWDLSNFLSDFQ